jgi:hypothetical protein
MYRFAQNYPQLINQATLVGFNASELSLLQRAFGTAQSMSHGFYRASGIPLLNHLVSTASIVLADTREQTPVVLALLHAAYVLHRFDDSTVSRNLAKRRKDISREFGPYIEGQLWKYQNMPWYRNSAVQDYLQRPEELDEDTRLLLTLRLANELDDHLDDAMSFTRLTQGDRTTKVFLESCRLLAIELKLPVIASELESLIRSESERATSDDKPVRPGWSRIEGYEFHQPIWRMSALEKVKYRLRQSIARLRRSLRR